MSTFNTNTGSINEQLMQLYLNLGGVMNPDESSSSYSIQGWLAKINEATSGGIGGGVSGYSGQIINGVANFVEATAPNFRKDQNGNNIGALVIGDRWEKSDDGTSWFWNGTYWLSTSIYSVGGQIAVNIPVTGYKYLSNPSLSGTLAADLFIETVSVLSAPGQSVSFGDVNNYKIFQFGTTDTGSNVSSVHATPPSYTLSPQGYTQTVNIAVSTIQLRVGQSTVGSPPANNPLLVFNYRYRYAP